MAQILRTKIISSWPFLVIILGSLLLYSYRLDFVPVHLNQDELEFSLNAYSISRTLHDSYGNFLPFYFWHLGSFWATPIIVYLTAMFLKFLPLSEAVIRLPSVFIGLTSIVLVMILSNKIFKRRTLALLSGVLMATTPVFFMQSRLLLDNLYILPFVLLWLIFLKGFSDKEKRVWIFLSGLALGVGLHSYHAAKVMMPVYVISTLVFLFMEKKRSIKTYFLFLAGFFIPIVLFIPWLSSHPDTLLNQVSYAGSIDKTINVQEGLSGVFNLGRFNVFTSSYLTYLAPSILFFTGDRSIIHSTHTTGAFLFPLIFLLVFGVLAVIFKKKDNFSKLILFGFLSYPIAPSLINDPERISRGLVAIIFVVILCVYGLEFLLSFRDRIFKVLVGAVFVVSFAQFILFLQFYFGDYRKVSYNWFNNDIGGALTSAIKSTEIRKVDTLYVDNDIYFIDKYLLFYQIKTGVSLDEKLKLYDYLKDDFSLFPKNSLVLVASNHVVGRQEKMGKFEKVETIREPDGRESFYVFFRGE